MSYIKRSLYGCDGHRCSFATITALIQSHLFGSRSLPLGMNHANYYQRLTFINSILELNHLQASAIDPIEYDAECPAEYNNFIYLVSLSTPTTSAQTLVSKSGTPGFATCLLPPGSTSFIIRLTNDHPGTGVNNTNRVENEVAFMALLRRALAPSAYSHIVPGVYCWASVSSGQGFIILQHMPGTMVDKVFEELSLDDKRVILGQMADILALMQNVELPDTVTALGGLSFDDQGEIVSAEMTLLNGGPFENQEDLLKAHFKAQLEESEAPNNLLFDAKTLQVTAVLDFDFSSISTVAEEYTRYSFSHLVGGRLPGPFSADTKLLVRTYMLSGFPSPLPESADDTLKLANIWDKELIRSGAKMPRNIAGFEKLTGVYYLQDLLCPFVLVKEFARKRRTEEELAAIRKRTEEDICKVLDLVGY
ncbi:hypothetical protein BGZ83_006285 [Gryganskiella cystojenkinii]|nr:hypothetical protein BGZ83_006285 [Gryganskiella cystojenkinii]